MHFSARLVRLPGACEKSSVMSWKAGHGSAAPQKAAKRRSVGRYAAAQPASPPRAMVAAAARMSTSPVDSMGMLHPPLPASTTGHLPTLCSAQGWSKRAGERPAMMWSTGSSSATRPLALSKARCCAAEGKTTSSVDMSPSLEISFWKVHTAPLPLAATPFAPVTCRKTSCATSATASPPAAASRGASAASKASAAASSA